MVKTPQHVLDKVGTFMEDPEPDTNPATGTVRQKQLTNANGETFIFMQKFDGTHWVVKDSELDLTKTTKDGKLPRMAKTPDIIPDADKLYDNGYNVLLIGLHGTGKTVSIQDMVKRRGIKMKYYSCATLDPFTDLVGVPVPKDTHDKDGKLLLDEYGQPKQTLQMVRPRDVDEADIIFFDELNRADAKTLNAVFEIIQFKTINGEPLPNLKVCWAAINPPDENYDVERLDEALLDRFDLYVNVDPQPSISYMRQFMPVQYAQALQKWWSEHNQEIRKKQKDAKMDYISPRRLLKLGLIWETFGTPRMIHMALPQGGNFDKGKLVDLLRAADKNINNGHEEEVVEEVSPLGQRPHEAFTYDKSWMKLNQTEVADFLKDNPTHYETHHEVAETLKSGIGAAMLIDHYSDILEGLDAKILEGLVQSYGDPKVSIMRTAFKAMISDGKADYVSHANLRSVLGGDKHFPINP